ncbi:MAG: iron uptake system protein EfeO [Paracoccus sp. (in: a-proteobacteria)]|uniref:iron uptake system protein EfeO n=1 Tax=Paracoccus sp. TaxID=267 RepID=UPI0039E5B5D8
MSNPPSRAIYIAILGAAALAVAGGAAFWEASRRQAADTPDADQQITVTATECQPNTVTVAGGRRSFQIQNASDRPIEWEIVDGVMVVAERENIAPGFSARLEAQLQPGRYDMTCGLLSNPRGTLTVTPSDEASAAASEVTLKRFLGPLSEYRVYLVMQGNAAVKSAQALEAAIASGDLEAARAAWAKARLPYRRIEPMAYRLSDLENAIDPSAAYLARREEDPGFTGYHRLEYGLFRQGSTQGLAPVAEKLVADLQALAKRLKEMPLDPALLLDLPGPAATRLAEAQVPQGENAYAGNDPQDFQASVEGIGKLTGLLGQLAASVDPALHDRIQTAQKRAEEAVAAMQGRPYDQVPAQQRQGFAQDLAALAADLGKLRPVIGMN